MDFIQNYQYFMNIVFSTVFILLGIFFIIRATFCNMKGEMRRYNTIKDRKKILKKDDSEHFRKLIRNNYAFGVLEISIGFF